MMTLRRCVKIRDR